MKAVVPRYPHIRVAEAGDNHALLELSRATPMEADVSLCIERDPDFFSLVRARGHGRTLIAEWEGRIVACGSVCRRRAYLMRQVGEMGHVADVKVAARFRQRGFAQSIMDEIAKGERERQPAPYVGSVAAGNRATDAMIVRFGRDQTLVRLGAFTAYQLLPLRRYRVTRGVEIGRAEPRDESELVEFLDAYHRRYSFAPVFRDGGFRRLLDRCPGMDLGNYRLARRNGRICAALAVWDESGVKRSRISKMTTRLRLISRFVRVAGRVVPLPPFPVEGECLRFVYLRHPAFAEGAIDALAGLVRSVVNEISVHRLQFALFTCADGDPIRRCIRGIAHTRYHYGLLAGTNASAYESALSRFRGAMLFDDAALS